MIKNIKTIYGKEIKVGDDFKNYFNGDYTTEKIVSEIKETQNGVVYQIIFRDGTMIETSYKNLSKIRDS